MPQKSVGTSATLLVMHDPLRSSLSVTNESAIAMIRVGKDIIDVANSEPVYAKNSIVFAKVYGDDPTLARYVVSDTLATTVSFTEEFV